MKKLLFAIAFALYAMIVMGLLSCSKSTDAVNQPLEDFNKRGARIVGSKTLDRTADVWNPCRDEMVHFKGSISYTINVTGHIISYTMDFSRLHGLGDSSHCVYFTQQTLTGTAQLDTIRGSVPLMLGTSTVFVPFRTFKGPRMEWREVIIFIAEDGEIVPQFFETTNSCE